MAVDAGLVPTRQPEVFKSASQSLSSQRLPAFQHLGLLRVPLSAQPHWLLLWLTVGLLICFPWLVRSLLVLAINVTSSKRSSLAVR